MVITEGLRMEFKSSRFKLHCDDAALETWSMKGQVFVGIKSGKVKEKK